MRRNYRRVIAVREIDVRLAVETGQQSRVRRAHRADSSPCVARAPRGKAPHRASNKPSPRASGASSLDSNSACKPRQMPRNGTPARIRSSSASRTCNCVERAHHLAEVAHAGQHDFRRVARNPAASRTSAYSAPIVSQRVLHRTQIARAVIEDGDHSNPFVEGNWSSQPLVGGAGVLHARARST